MRAPAGAALVHQLSPPVGSSALPPTVHPAPHPPTNLAPCLAPTTPPRSTDSYCLDCRARNADCKRCSNGLERVSRPDGQDAWAFPNVVYPALEGGLGVCKEW